MYRKLIAVVLAALLLVLTALTAAAVDAFGVAFVYTSNGKGLNLRSGPDTNHPSLTSI